jgi:hypothetical protein
MFKFNETAENGKKKHYTHFVLLRYAFGVVYRGRSNTMLPCIRDRKNDPLHFVTTVDLLH